MAKTIDDAIAEARAILQDTSPTGAEYRYSTPDLVSYLNNALLEMRKLRPDLFRTYYGADTPSYTESDLGGNVLFPVDNMFFPPAVFYMVGTAELRDDEFTVDSRAVTLMSQFTAKLVTVA